MKKYKLIDRRNGFYRVKALRDIPRYGVKAGDLGGYVGKEENLSHEGSCWIFDDAKIWGNAWVCDNAFVCDNAHIWGNAWVYDKALIYGDVKVYGNARVFGKATVYGDARVCDNARVCSNAQVWGNAHASGNSVVSSQHDIVTLTSIRHSITATNAGIAVGCELRTLAEWKKKYHEIGDRAGYSKEECELYLKLIITAHKIYLAQQEKK